MCPSKDKSKSGTDPTSFLIYPSRKTRNAGVSLSLHSTLLCLSYNSLPSFTFCDLMMSFICSAVSEFHFALSKLINLFISFCLSSLCSFKRKIKFSYNLDFFGVFMAISIFSSDVCW